MGPVGRRGCTRPRCGPRPLAVGENEHVDDIVQLHRLVLGLLDGRVRLLDQRRVVLGHFVHLAHGDVDLLDAGRLFPVILGNGVHQRIVLPHRHQHGIELGCRLCHQPAAACNL